MKIRKYLSALIIFGIFFVSCMPANFNADTTSTPISNVTSDSVTPVNPTNIPIVISITPSNTITPTPTITSTILFTLSHKAESTLLINPNKNITDRIFLFTSAFGFLYSTIQLNNNKQETVDLSSYGISSEIVGSSVTLSFSHFSNKVAFWFREDSNTPGTLWVADIEMNTAQLIFTDESQSFNSDDTFPPRDVVINWLPNDRYFFVEPINSTAPTILVDAVTGDYHPNWQGNCNSVITSQKTPTLALMCDEQNKSLVIEWDGTIWVNENKETNILWSWDDHYMLPLNPSGIIPSWSQDGTKIAFIPLNKPNTLEIITSFGDSLSIALDVEALFPHTIQWATNNTILVGGYNKDWPASWFIIDSNTGEVLWNLKDITGFDFTIEQQRDIFAINNAQLSPDGSYLLLSTNRVDIPSGNELLLIDVKNKKYIDSILSIGRGLNAYKWAH